MKNFKIFSVIGTIVFLQFSCSSNVRDNASDVNQEKEQALDSSLKQLDNLIISAQLKELNQLDSFHGLKSLESLKVLRSLTSLNFFGNFYTFPSNR